MISWFTLLRIPEPEVMEDSAEVEAYASAAAQAYLDKIDDTFVAHALRLVRGRTTGLALDIGTGPGQIVLKLARRLPSWHFIGVDRSVNMIKQARGSELQLRHRERKEGERASAPQARIQFFLADANRLPFRDATFDLVLSNSVLHHLAEPQHMLSEIARLVKPGGAILVRDLRRPSRLAYPLHVRWYGRHYSGLMYELYCASVRSSYTVRELRELLRQSPLQGASVFKHHRTHLGMEQGLKVSF